MEKHKRTAKDCERASSAVTADCRLITRDAGIHFRGPSENAAMQIIDFSETRLAQEVYGLRRTLAAAAMGDDFVRGIEFMHAARQFSERN